VNRWKIFRHGDSDSIPRQSTGRILFIMSSSNTSLIFGKDPVQVLARVSKRGSAGDSRGRKAVVEVILGDTPAQTVESNKFVRRIPHGVGIVEWFETILAPKVLDLPPETKVQAQLNEEDKNVTLYVDSRFVFDCFCTRRTDRFQGLDQLCDPAQYEFAQDVALGYFGPRRVPSHFRRRQAVLVRVHGIIRRRMLLLAWRQLCEKASPGKQVNDRLVELLTRNLARNRDFKLQRDVFNAWLRVSTRRHRRNEIVLQFSRKIDTTIKKIAFQKLFRNALTEKVAELVKEYKPETNDASSSSSQLVGTNENMLSPQSIIKHMMQEHLDLDETFVARVLQESPKLLKQQGSNGIRMPSKRRARIGSLSSPGSPMSPSSGIPPKAKLASIRRAANNGHARHQSPLSEYLKAQRRQREQRQHESKHHQNTNPGSSSMISGSAESQESLQSGSLNEEGDSALSAWRRQAMMQQQKLCQGMCDDSFNTTAEVVDPPKKAMPNTPLSAGLVNKWRVVVSPPSGNSSSDSSIGPQRNMSLSSFRIPETPGAVETSSKSSSFQTPLASSAASMNKRMQRQHSEIESLLHTLGLEQFHSKFVEEELTDVKLLMKICAADKKEFKETLVEIGMLKIGQRERLIRALMDEAEASSETASKRSSSSKKSKKRKRRTSKMSESSYLRALQESKWRENEAKRLASTRSKAQIHRLVRQVLNQFSSSIKTGRPDRVCVMTFPPEKLKEIQIKRLKPVFRKTGQVEAFQQRCNYYRRLGLKV